MQAYAQQAHAVKNDEQARAHVGKNGHPESRPTTNCEYQKHDLNQKGGADILL
jgi:hypothetical protein